MVAVKPYTRGNSMIFRAEGTYKAKLVGRVRELSN